MTPLAKVTAGLISITLAALTGLPARDGIRDRQWHLAFLAIEQAHAISTGEGVVVGVIDTGVDAGHPDLAGRLLPGADFTFFENSDAWEDLNGHGTAMAGIIAAHGQALGIAPGATILPVRDSTDGLAFVADTANAVEWAVLHGATVLCLAQGAPGSDMAMRAAVEYAIENDVVVVAGVGNVPDVPPIYPAAYPGVVAVAGVDRDGNHADVSVVSPVAVLAAPAVDIMTPRARNVVPGGYGPGTGTSDATAIVAGVAALVRSAFPELSAAEVIHRMTATADDRGAPGRDDEYGYGIVNPVAALTADIAPLEPTDTPTGPTVTAGPSQTAGTPPGSPGPVSLLAVLGVGVAVLLIVGLAVGLRRRS